MWRFPLAQAITLVMAVGIFAAGNVRSEMVVVLGSYTERQIAVRELGEYRQSLATLSPITGARDEGVLESSEPASPTLLILVQPTRAANGIQRYRLVYSPFIGFSAASIAMSQWHAQRASDAWILQHHLPLIQ